MGIINWLTGRDDNSLDLQRSGLRAGRFGTDRYQPPGEWVQTTPLIAVAGISHHKAEVLRFFAAVQSAERSAGQYGIELRPEPSNKHDPKAIAIDGAVGERRWHIGFLDRETAAEITDDLVAKGVPVGGEIYNLWASDDGIP